MPKNMRIGALELLGFYMIPVYHKCSLDSRAARSDKCIVGSYVS